MLIENTSLHAVEENRASTQIRQPSYFIARSINIAKNEENLQNYPHMLAYVGFFL